MHVCVCVHVCVPALRLLVTSGMMWCDMDRLTKFYSFDMAAVVDIVSRCGHSIDGCVLMHVFKRGVGLDYR